MLLAEENFALDSIDTKATVTLKKQNDGFTVSAVHLEVHAHILGIDQVKFEEIANKAKTGCPISKLLNANATLDATLES